MSIRASVPGELKTNASLSRAGTNESLNDLRSCYKRNKKNSSESKTVLFLFNVISAYLNAFLESFKKFLKTVSEGLQKNSVQFGRHDFLNAFSILRLLSVEGNFHLRKEKKNAIKKIWIVLTSLDEVLA
jgi:hypothetical protein